MSIVSLICAFSLSTIPQSSLTVLPHEIKENVSSARVVVTGSKRKLSVLVDDPSIIDFTLIKFSGKSAIFQLDRIAGGNSTIHFTSGSGSTFDLNIADNRCVPPPFDVQLIRPNDTDLASKEPQITPEAQTYVESDTLAVSNKSISSAKDGISSGNVRLVFQVRQPTSVETATQYRLRLYNQAGVSFYGGHLSKISTNSDLPSGEIVSPVIFEATAIGVPLGHSYFVQLFIPGLACELPIILGRIRS